MQEKIALKRNEIYALLTEVVKSTDWGKGKRIDLSMGVWSYIDNAPIFSLSEEIKANLEKYPQALREFSLTEQMTHNRMEEGLVFHNGCLCDSTKEDIWKYYEIDDAYDYGTTSGCVASRTVTDLIGALFEKPKVTDYIKQKVAESLRVSVIQFLLDRDIKIIAFIPLFIDFPERPVVGVLGLYFRDKEQYKPFRESYSKFKYTVCGVVAPYVMREYYYTQIAHATKSAIGSIMSRNGSHNIGSHVLSALSHSVGVRPDDRVLYKYIQHRMDYVATVTTDFPTWSSPTWFVRDLMRRFYMQKNLLEYIAASEGLGAYHFQDGHGNKIPAGCRQEGKLTFRIIGTTIDSNGERVADKKIIISERYDEAKNRFEDDFQLAIPGGVVGQQAFFTILENIIRNSAKHSWSDAKMRNGEKNLEITIEFTNDHRHNDQEIEFIIWDNISNVQCHKPKKTDAQEDDTEAPNGLSKKGRRDKKDDPKQSEADPILETLNTYFKRPLIDNDGALIREAWGLAEMRISTGFLRGRDVSWIGKGEFAVGDLEAIPYPDVEYCRREHHRDPKGNGQRPQGHRDGNCSFRGESEACINCAERWHIGYKFSLPRPKEMLVWGVLGDHTPDWKQRSVTVKKAGEPAPQLYDFSYVVVDGNILDDLWLRWESEFGDTLKPFAFVSQFPFRLIVVGECKFVDQYVIGEKSMLHWKHVCHIIDEEVCKTLDQASREGSREFKEQIYKQWLKHLSRRRQSDVGGEGFPLHLQPLDAAHSSSNSKKGLITGVKIAEHVIQQHLSIIVKGLKASGRAISVVDAIRNRYLEPIPTVLLYGLCETLNWDEDNYPSSCKQIIRKWLSTNGCTDPLLSLLLGDPHSPLKTVLSPPAEQASSEQKAMKDLLEMSLAHTRGREAALDTAEKDILEFDLLHSFITAFVTAKSMLEGYEEYIETIPVSYIGGKESADEENAEHETASPGKAGHSKSVLIGNTGITLAVGAENRRELKNPDALISYQRHRPIEKDFIDVDLERDCVLWEEKVKDREGQDKTGTTFAYIESLSGTQSYLSVLESIRPEAYSEEDVSMLCGLVENAQIRYLVVDERMLEFVDEHASAADVFRGIRVEVASELKNFPNQKEKIFTVKHNVDVGITIDFKDLESCEEVSHDVLLIHQGIIDKMLTSNDEESVGEFLNSVSRQFPYVVITTGRGTPSNTPSFGKVLPFSNVESYLFSKHPQKLLISNLLMSMLPHIKKE